MNPIVVIPARMASTRLPGKPLADIHGRPMIVHVLDRGREAEIGPVAVACGDAEIADAVRAAGGRAVLTDPDLPSRLRSRASPHWPSSIRTGGTTWWSTCRAMFPTIAAGAVCAR